MNWAAVLLASLALIEHQDAGGATRPSDMPAPQAQPDDTDLGEIVVEGQRLRDVANAYVRSIAAPVVGRKAAKWSHDICVGVMGLQREAAGQMADRVSDWAFSLGLAIKAPGCEPDVIIVVAENGDEAARQMVRSKPRLFRTGISHSDVGGAALRRFQNSGQTVRWWHVSVPVDDDSGQPIGRLPGQAPFAGGEIRSANDAGAFGRINRHPSRLSDASRDDLMRAIVVIDADAFDQAGFGQVADYVSMVALAQIAPDAQPTAPSILNLFEAGAQQEDTLTSWDVGYLHALYSTSQNRIGQNANLSRLASSVAQELRRPDEGD